MRPSSTTCLATRAYRSGSADTLSANSSGGAGAGAVQTPARRVGLATMAHIQAVHNLTYEQALSKVEVGELRFAFDVSCRRRIRSIRVWRGGGEATLAQAIDSLIGTQRARLSAVEVGRILVCSRPHTHRLIKWGFLKGEIRGHVAWVTRESLVQFLTSRVVC